jgi:hypothetical protein
MKEIVAKIFMKGTLLFSGIVFVSIYTRIQGDAQFEFWNLFIFISGVICLYAYVFLQEITKE